MAILSKRIVSSVASAYHRQYGVRTGLVDLSGNAVGDGEDELAVLGNSRRRRNYALQESVNLGGPYTFDAAPGVATWVVALENRRFVHGGLLGGGVLVEESEGGDKEVASYLASNGMGAARAKRFVARLPRWPAQRVEEAAQSLQELFYQVSGWRPELMEENKLRAQQQRQISQAIEDQRKHGQPALYAFEKERMLLAHIRAGDRNGARRLLNEMLAAIYMSTPKPVVLRARAIELITCLTRAAIEDNPLLEPMIEENHAWTERLIRANSFEELSHVLMGALDDFIDAIYLHGLNRSNMKVRTALDYISRHATTQIAVGDVAKEVGLSSSRLAHLVKEYTGRSVLQIVHQVRIRHAQQLLERTTKSCTDIAYEVGYGDQSYFIRHFRRYAGTTPARFRRLRSAP